MRDVTVVVHGHFYQPPRENPWTEVVPREPSASPFHDWNERITAECYRPNGAAHVVDDRGRILALVDNYRLLSFNMGPTLLSWMEEHEPEVYDRVVADGAGGIAQGFGHLILPLAHERDVRTQVRWGLADFRHRFGREAAGLWLPECAVDENVLSVLAEEGVGFTILAPDQIEAVRPLAEPDADWTPGVAPGRPLRWCHPSRPDLSMALLVYDGALSHDIAFDLGRLSSHELVARAAEAPGPLVAIATDGETFGHHHRWAERAIAYALAVEAPRQGVRSATANDAVGMVEPTHVARVRTSAWSCAHGVERWRSDCGCATGGEPGWDQAWRAPLRAALDLLRDALFSVARARSEALFGSVEAVWAARDAYIEVLLGAVTIDDFTSRWVSGDPVDALTLLEALRAGMSMYTSCGWFFNDLAGIETVQLLRYAGLVLDHLRALGEDADHLEGSFLDVLAGARSNRHDAGSGADLWRSEVLPARVDTGRVAAHVALSSVLGRHAPGRRTAVWDVDPHHHVRIDHGSAGLAVLRATVTHRRTRRSATHAVVALRIGGLEVVGTVLDDRQAGAPEDATAEADDLGEVLTRLEQAFAEGVPVAEVLRRLGALGGRGFDLDAALPDSAEQLLTEIADGLVERFSSTLDLLLDHSRPTIEALLRLGYPLPPELRGPLDLALSHRIETLVDHAGGSTRLGDYDDAVALARSPLAAGATLDTPIAQRILTRLLGEAVDRALDPGIEGSLEASRFAGALLTLAAELGIAVDATEPQEQVLRALLAGGRGDLHRLGQALGLAVDQLGLP